MKKILVLSTIIISIITTSCNLTNLVQGEVKTTPNPGTVYLQIPVIPGYMNFKNPSIEESSTFVSSGSRALGMTTGLNIEISDGVNPPITATGVVPDDIMATSAFVSIDVPEGTGYTATVEVFNSAVSSVDPTVTGTSETFDIVAGDNTYIMITALPTSTTELPLNTSQQSPSGPPSEIDLGTNSYTNIGVEYWYEVTGITSESISITFTHNTADSLNGYIYAAAFDSTGGNIATAYSPGLVTGTGDTPCELSFASTPGESYYLCVMPLTLASNPDTDSEFGISCAPGVSDDEYEENDDTFNATALVQGTTLNAVCLDDDYYSFSLTAETNVTILCEFLHMEGDLDIELLNETGTWLATSDTTTDNETITEILPAGTYFINVYPFSSGATEYSISWTAN